MAGKTKVVAKKTNLIPGGRGAAIRVEWQGIQQTAFLLAAICNEKLPGTLNASHTRMMGVVGKRAEANFEGSIRRPNERGERGGPRETGHFTFGKDQGGAFIGVPIRPDSPGGKKDEYGFGYPNIKVADQKTNFVWRALEFGLTGAKYTAVNNEFAPRGIAKFPSRFTFLPFRSGPPNGSLVPKGSGSAPSGTLVTPKGRVLKTVAHPGIKPKLFITNAFNETVGGMDREYQTVLATTFKDFT